MPAPTIPTSFVPHQQFVPSSTRPKRSGRNMLLIVAIVVFAGTLIGAGGVFAYEKYLQSVRDNKEATVAKEEQGIDPNTVESFIALSNRLAAANTILNNHITMSPFFDLLEGITLQDVSITSLSVTVADDRTATLALAGTAKSFNALAAESSAFAQQPLIKHAIFSGLNASKDGTVEFTVAADIDPKLITASSVSSFAATSTQPAPTSVSAAVPAATSTLTSTTTSAKAALPASTLATSSRATTTP